jgi:hypothetical protein
VSYSLLITVPGSSYSTAASHNYLSTVVSHLCGLDAVTKGLDTGGMSFDCQLFVSILFTHNSEPRAGGACAVRNLYWEGDFHSNIAGRAGQNQRGASYEMRLRANPDSLRHSRLLLDFEHSATTTQLFAGAMGDVESEVAACRCPTEDTTVSVDCNVIVQRLGSVSRVEKAH